MISDLSIHFYGFFDFHYFAQRLEVFTVTISQRIFAELKKAKRTQKDLSVATGIPTSTISAWNKNGALPSADYIVPLARELGVSVLYLLTGEKESNPNEFLTKEEQILLENYRKLGAKQKNAIFEHAENLAKLAMLEDAEAEKKDGAL